MILTETNLSTSSSTSIGALRYNTAFHSSQLSGATENTSCGGGQGGKTHNSSALALKNGMYIMPTCNTILRTIEPTRNVFFQSGNLNKLSFSDREFIALNISTVTRMVRLIVVAVLDISFLNISQPTSGKSEGHW